MFKALIISALLGVSAKALACPDLEGVYSCKLTGQTMELEIKQTKTAFSLRINAETNNFSNDKIAKVQKVTQFGMEITKSSMGSCSENSIIVETITTQENELQKFSNNVTIILEKTSASTANLKIKEFNLINGVVDSESLVEATAPCLKK